MTLSYNSDGSFTIMQITDTHIGDSPLSEASQKTLDLVKTALDRYQVDLVVHTGDITWSEGVNKQLESLQSFLDCFHGQSTPLITTLGNHDSEGAISRDAVRKYIEADAQVNHAPKKQIQVMDSRESCLLEIYGSDQEAVKTVIYVIDSGDYPKIDYGTYDWVSFDQVAWFRQVAQDYPDPAMNNLLFLHIPLPEYKEAGHHIIEGHFNEGDHEICSPDLNSGLFTQLVEAGNIWGVFAGHDHDNNFDGIYCGIHCLYGQVSGYDTYGDEARGVRLITLDENDNTVSTERILADDIL
ncbi:cyclic 3',5'-adenosine monophosphate phosphodiesterase [Alloiococcus otitis]|uniref:Calcineurin-like phosphoesterase domain-containing protein n=1 Tax=Alloiococcus otitis ATCC 51267 TaxID=883081 RepID=K9EDK7_9LACT|nr:metallophosphoesterase family protein [Alloiococcus otitis]EKU93906.1 hypothetical protein HMPREF9698_00583 [Alloiococcus otitis ATCC 51267]SUU81720.1 cyclic 3',5'-adenosine monophosphate phosphodiesterase [Alloiococcus otitis]